jgi:hypothetical protein
LKGTTQAIIPQVELSVSSFHFGDIGIGDQFEIPFTVTNQSDELPIQFEIQRVAHFHAQPSSGKLLPHQSLDAAFIFRPKQVRNHPLFLPLGLTLSHFLSSSVCSNTWWSSTFATE